MSPAKEGSGALCQGDENCEVVDTTAAINARVERQEHHLMVNDTGNHLRGESNCLTANDFTLVNVKYAKGPDGKTVKRTGQRETLREFHLRITDPDGPLARQTAATREHLSDGQKTPRFNEAKGRHPQVLPTINSPVDTPVAGIAAHGDFHNTLYGFDIDKGAQDWGAIRAKIIAHPAAVFVATSTSGDGLYAFFAGTPASSGEDYTAKWMEFKGLLPADVRVSTAENSHEINRVRYVCHDPHAWVNGRIKPMELRATPVPPPTPLVPAPSSSSPLLEEDGALVTGALAHLAEAQVGTDDNKVVAVGTCLKSMGRLFPEFDSWASGAGCTCVDRAARWESFKTTDSNYDTVLGLATKAGWRRPVKARKKSKEKGAGRPKSNRTLSQEQLAADGWFVDGRESRMYVERGTQTNAVKAMVRIGADQRFAWNEWTGNLEDEGRGIVDMGGVITDIRGKLESAFLNVGYSPTRGAVDEAITHHGRQHAYNSAVEKIRAQEWDGVDRLTRYGSHVYMVPEDDALGNAVAALIPRGAVVRALHPGAVFPYIPIIQSKDEGPGKGDSLKYLAPGGYAEGLELTGFDYQRKLQERGLGKSILEIGEFFGLYGPAKARVKAIATSEQDYNRLSYDRIAIEQDRSFIIVGTTNADYFLTDTEHRRHPVVRVPLGSTIALDWLKENVAQVWAQVAHEFDTGTFRHWDSRVAVRLPREIWAQANEDSRKYEQESSLGVWLADFLEEKDQVKSKDLVTALVDSKIRWSDSALSLEMGRLQWSRCRLGHKRTRAWEFKGERPAATEPGPELEEQHHGDEPWRVNRGQATLMVPDVIPTMPRNSGADYGLIH